MSSRHCRTVAGALLAISLAGCSSTPAAETALATPVPTATVTATPTPISATPATTCTTAFVDTENTKLAVDGLLLRTPAESGDPTMYTNRDLDALGVTGLRCQWVKPGSDNVVWYAEWPGDLTTWAAVRVQLIADGYTATGDLSVARRVSEFDSAVTYRDGVLRYTSPSSLIGWVRVLD